MNTYRYTVGELPNILLQLGVQGENEMREIQIDFSEWMTEGVVGNPEIKVLTPSGVLYWADTKRGSAAGLDDENVISWVLKTLDTSESGNGLIRLTLFGEDGERLKSAAAHTYLAPEFDEAIPRPVPAEIWQSWVDELGEDAAESKTNAYNAANDAAAAEAYAIAIKEGRLDLIDGLMNLATAMTVTIDMVDWIYDDGRYVVAKSNAIITEDTAAILHLDEENAAKCQSCIEMETGDGIITFRTDTIPTDDIIGTLILQGRFADSSPEIGRIFENLTVIGNPSETASAELTHIDGQYTLTLGLPQGPAGSLTDAGITVTIPAASWSGSPLTYTATGLSDLTANSNVVISPAPASRAVWAAAGIACTAQNPGSLTFTAAAAPTDAVTANILIL